MGPGDRAKVLKALTHFSLILLAVAAAWSGCGPVRVVGLSVAVFGLLFWGLPYFGQLFSHATGDLAIVLGLAGVVALRERLTDPIRFAPYCAGFGATIVSFEFLTGQLPTAAGLMRLVRRLLQKADTLTWGNETVAVPPFSLHRAGLDRGGGSVGPEPADGKGVSEAGSDFLALATGAAVVGAWILVFQTHTLAHPAFMVRILIVPIVLGWAALFWQIRIRRQLSGSSHTAQGDG